LEIDKQKLKCILLTARDLNITSYFWTSWILGL
jgi:hypothetical protein